MDKMKRHQMIGIIVVFVGVLLMGISFPMKKYCSEYIEDHYGIKED